MTDRYPLGIFRCQQFGGGWMYLLLCNSSSSCNLHRCTAYTLYKISILLQPQSGVTFLNVMKSFTLRNKDKMRQYLHWSLFQARLPFTSQIQSFRSSEVVLGCKTVAQKQYTTHTSYGFGVVLVGESPHFPMSFANQLVHCWKGNRQDANTMLCIYLRRIATFLSHGM